MSATRILVTGAAGYIGSVLCRQLLDRGFRVRGFDRLLFGGDSLIDLVAHPNFEFVKGDVRDLALVEEALVKVDAVVHLAALVGDKACKIFAEEATEVMKVASEALFLRAAALGVGHFVFASTCSNYGIMEGLVQPLLDEDAPLRPQSHYARLKVGFEEFVLGQSDVLGLSDGSDGSGQLYDSRSSGVSSGGESEGRLGTPGRSVMPWTILRFATVYGMSPRVRFDLSVNHFTRDLSLGRSLLIFGADTWRPYCHVQDLARSVIAVLEAGGTAMQGKVFNVGDSDENYTKRGLVEAILQQLPGGEVEFQASSGSDPRDYRIDFSRIRRELDFQISMRVPDGIREIHTLVRSGLLADPDSSQYINA